MIIQKNIILVLTGILSLLSYEQAFSQATIKKEVEVVQPYKPEVADAKKLDLLPVINDSTTIKPAFQYNVTPVMINTEYQVSQINAAKMLNMPYSKLYNGYLLLGYGNYNTPDAELYLNTLRSRKYSAGARFDYQSSSGNLTLDNNASVFAGYSNASAEIFGKSFINDDFLLYADGEVKGNTVYDYGYNPLVDTLLQNNTIKQSYLYTGIKAGLQSFNSDSSRLRYNALIKYSYFQDRFNHTENNFYLVGNLSKIYNNKTLALDFSFDRLDHNKTLDSAQEVNSLFTLYPSVCFSNREYRLQLGFNVIIQHQLNLVTPWLFPMADFQFVVVKDVLIPFVGVYGKVYNHSYQDIAAENPYIKPNLLVYDSNDKQLSAFYGGIKGSLGSKASYILKFNYSQLENDYFFVNDYSSVLGNQFTVVYDNVNLFTYSADVSYDITTEWSFAAKVNFYEYQMTNQLYAWEKPKSDATFSLKYNLSNKILVNFDVLEMGKRYTTLYSNPELYQYYRPGYPNRVIPSTLDFNLGAEYRYTKILSFWIYFNNFTAAKYYMWNQYPAQRFNMMAGISYSL